MFTYNAVKKLLSWAESKSLEDQHKMATELETLQKEESQIGTPQIEQLINKLNS